MRGKALIATALGLVLPLLLIASGCGSSGGGDGSAPPPGGGADIRGYVSSVWGISADPRPSDVLGSITIEGELEEGTRFDRASVAVTEKTRIFEDVNGERVQAAFGDLEEGQLVQAVFTGPVAESYPVQATAGEITILGRTAIGAVRDRHEAELLAIEGVVGFGISSRGGKPVIVVYLENDSPALKERIPTRLEGFEVLTEVTGPIEAQPL